MLKFIPCNSFLRSFSKFYVITRRHVPKHNNLHTMKSTNALTLQLRFYAKYDRTLARFDLSIIFRELLYVFLYTLLMLSNSLKMIKIDWNMSESWQILCKNVIWTSVYLLDLLYELFVIAWPWITLRLCFYISGCVWPHCKISDIKLCVILFKFAISGLRYSSTFTNTRWYKYFVPSVWSWCLRAVLL
jgi:hypothetical protein